MDYASILLNATVLLIGLHILFSSLVWIIRHNKNGWVYAVLPLIVGINVVSFSGTTLLNRILTLGIDPIFLNYWSQCVRILSLACFAVAIRMHLRYIQRINLSGFYK